MSDPGFELKPQDLAFMSEADTLEMIRTGRLTGENLKRWWRNIEMQGEPPSYIELFVRKSDLEKLRHGRV